MSTEDPRDDAGDATSDDMVGEAALQLWSAPQTDFDPFEVPPEEWAEDPVPVRDIDIAYDTHLDVEVVRAALHRLDGRTLVVGRDAGNWSVTRVIPQAPPP